ncbi:hypothetical protein JHK85_022656 [Glycine max]|nr:hypothetical protein JHK85_022656 [Glycine max]
MEQRVEDAENQGQTGESVSDPGLMDEFIPDMNREDPIGDSQEMMSHSAGRTDSGSKIGCSTESVESGEKIKIMKHDKSSFANNCALPESDFAIANGIGPPKGESNYEAAEFDPIVHHNQCCPWVNGNVAAAGCASSVPSSDAIALSVWQLTIDALDALSLGHNAIPTVPSESAASLYKFPLLKLSEIVAEMLLFSRLLHMLMPQGKPVVQQNWNLALFCVANQ